jgi:hypothetical protein
MAKRAFFSAVMNFTRAEARKREQNRKAWLMVTTAEPKKTSSHKADAEFRLTKPR